GQSVTVLEDRATRLFASVSDANDDPLTFAMAQAATNGVVTFDSRSLSFIYTPNANFVGADSFSYKVVDPAGGFATATVSVTVLPVNDAPSFIKGPDQNVVEDAGTISVSSWATAISVGPANEASQTVSFVVTTDNDSLFSVLPQISPNGTLTYTLASN